jgi:hypothetical protein
MEQNSGTPRYVLHPIARTKMVGFYIPALIVLGRNTGYVSLIIPPGQFQHQYREIILVDYSQGALFVADVPDQMQSTHNLP